MYTDVLSDKDIELIIKKYQHPERKSSTNYLNFYNDVYSKSEDNKNKESSSQALIQMRPIQVTFKNKNSSIILILEVLL